jgi:hypothetical protein
VHKVSSEVILFTEKDLHLAGADIRETVCGKADMANIQGDGQAGGKSRDRFTRG